MAIALEDWKDAGELIAELRKSDKSAAAYFAALVALAQGEKDKVKAEYDVLRQARSGRSIETRQWEVQGRMLCASGDRDAGLKLLKRAVDKLKDDYQHHAWGNGATLMEAWGETALACGATADAEEAFQEALAHDAGSVRGALGMWALCQSQDRTEEAARYLKLARKCWSRADERDFERLKKHFAEKSKQS